MTLPLTRRDPGRIPQHAIAPVCRLCGGRVAAYVWPPPEFCEPRCQRRWERLAKKAKRD